MRLVNGHQRQLPLHQHLRKSGNPQPFRRNKEELQTSVEIVHAGLAGHGAIQTRVDAGHAQPQRIQLGGLIVHQCNQRRDHQRGAFPRQRRQLVAERLSRARRHHQQQVASGNGRAADRLLVGAKALKAKDRSQQFNGIARFGERTHPDRRPIRQ